MSFLFGSNKESWSFPFNFDIARRYAEHADCQTTRYGEQGGGVACSPILLTTITVERLQKRGYESMLTYYLKIAPFLHEPSCM